jgi:hypothetical protein
MFAKLFEDRLEKGLKTGHFLGVRLASHEVFWPVAEPSKRASFRRREHLKQLPAEVCEWMRLERILVIAEGKTTSPKSLIKRAQYQLTRVAAGQKPHLRSASEGPLTSRPRPDVMMVFPQRGGEMTKSPEILSSVTACRCSQRASIAQFS